MRRINLFALARIAVGALIGFVYWLWLLPANIVVWLRNAWNWWIGY